MSELRKKTINGSIWSLTGRLLKQSGNFIIGIILARLLTPGEYGLLGMASVFIFISFAFVDSGFSYSLIHKSKCTDADYSTVFWINISISILFFGIFYFSAPFVSDFYKENSLTFIIRILSALVILFALSAVQRSIIIKNVNFKLLTRIEFVAQMLSGVIGISLAYFNFGVWALVYKTILNQVFINIQLWLSTKWLPSLSFSKSSFKEMFSYGSKLLISGLLQSVYNQIYTVIIGKFFSKEDLGLFTRANQFQSLPSRTLSNSVLSVMFPVLSKLKSNTERFKRVFLKALSVTMYFNINAMILLAVIAKPLILVLLGVKWIGSVEYLQLLIGVGIIVPMQGLNMQVFSTNGNSGLYLKNEIINKLLIIPSVLLGIFFDIKIMIIGSYISYFIGLYINMIYTKRLIDLKLIDQLSAIKGSVLVAFVSGVLAYIFGYILFEFSHNTSQLFIIFFVYISTLLVLSLIFRISGFLELKKIVLDKIQKSS